MRESDDSLRGRTVIASDGRAVGEIAAVFVDCDGWRVESLRVKLGRSIADELGVPRRMFRAGTVEVPIRLVQSVGDAVVLAVPVSRLRKMIPVADEPAPLH